MKLIQQEQVPVLNSEFDTTGICTVLYNDIDKQEHVPYYIMTLIHQKHAWYYIMTLIQQEHVSVLYNDIDIIEACSSIL